MEVLRRLSGAWLILLGMVSLAQAAPPSAYDFSKPSRFSGVELSPSGRYLAYLMVDNQKYCFDKDGQMVALDRSECGEKFKRYRSKHEVKIYDLKNSAMVNAITVPENFVIGWLEWASDERLLASLISPRTFGLKGRGYNPGASRVVSFPRVGGSLTPLFSGQGTLVRQNRNMSRITNLLRNDPDHVIMPANTDGDLDLYKVNVVTGKADRIEEGRADTFYWFTDGNGMPILRYDCKGRRCLKVDIYAPTADGEWEQIKRFTLKPDEDEDDFPFQPVAPSDVDGQYYVISREDDAARQTIRIYNFNTKSYVRTVFEHPDYDVAGAVLNHQTGAYAGAWYYKDRKTYALLDETQQKHMDALNTYFEDKENITPLGYNADGTQLIMYVTGPENAGEYYLYDFAGRNVERLFRRKTSMGERLPTSTDILSVPTRDGAAITAYHTYPLGAEKASAPLIVMPHGGPERRDFYDFDTWTQYFATRGYQVLRVNFRGSSGYGREFAEAGYGEWGGVMQNDLTDAVKHVQSKVGIGRDKTCIVGYSYGGYAALYGGASTPDLYACVVSGGGVSDIVADLKRTKVDSGGDSGAFEYWEKSMGDLSKDKDKLAAVSPVNLADNFTAPVLLIHGEFDYVVRPSQSEDMERALKKAKKSVEYLELEDSGHSGWSVEISMLYLETVEDFLRKNLK